MTRPLILLTLPNLRESDVARMPKLKALCAGGEIAELAPSVPAITCPVQAAMTTGALPRRHGIIGNGIFWREREQVEMWTAPNDAIERPQIWDLLSHAEGGPRSAVWFPMHAKGCEAEYVCTPAPIHNPDGSESLWCYTRPTELYGELRDRLGHFRLDRFWGPMAGIQSSQWIVDSAVLAAQRWQPEFFYIYLPHLDYAAQKTGPESPEATEAVGQLDEQIGRLADGFAAAYTEEPVWLVAGEYVITAVDRVIYPNRMLREAGLLKLKPEASGPGATGASPVAEDTHPSPLPEDVATVIDFRGSQAWAMADHQVAHVFVDGGDPALAARVADLFRGTPGVDEVLVGEERSRYGLDHPRSGEVVLICAPNAWMAYYWWDDESQSPSFARTVDIHRKPGYDPVELFFDPATKSIPLDATLVRGSHGAPPRDASQRTVLLASEPLMFDPLRPERDKPLADTDVFSIVMRHFGLNPEAT